MKNIHRFLLGLCALPIIACSPKTGNGEVFYTLKNDAGMQVKVTPFGGRITSVILPDRDGVERDIVLGFDRVEDYYPENHLSDFGVMPTASPGRSSPSTAGNTASRPTTTATASTEARPAGSTVRMKWSTPTRATSG